MSAAIEACLSSCLLLPRVVDLQPVERRCIARLLTDEHFHPRILREPVRLGANESGIVLPSSGREGGSVGFVSLGTSEASTCLIDGLRTSFSIVVSKDVFRKIYTSSVLTYTA